MTYGPLFEYIESKSSLQLGDNEKEHIRKAFKEREERYDVLVKTYPEFIRRFPQNMIASYLGISAETLSRIRKKTMYK